MDEWIYIWLGLIIVTVIGEIITVGLTSIWLSGGALAALIVCGLGGHWILQVGVFFIVTFVLLFFTRPWAMKYINERKQRTNYEEVLDKEVRVLEDVDNRQGCGRAVYNGMEWTARSASDDITFAAGEMARVVEVRGVKLIIEKTGV